MLDTRAILSILTIILLVGCTSTSDVERPRYTNEQLLESSGNDQELIKLYKQELLVEDSVTTRLKLVHSYIQTRDFESAIFYVQPLIEGEETSADAYFLYGKAKFGLNAMTEAQRSLQKAIKLDPNHGETLNLLGVIAAYGGDYFHARSYFVKARQRMIDDVTIKNNLAMIDLIEGQYESAVEKLTPLLGQDNVSQKVKSNLAFAYAKLSLYPQFSQLLEDAKLTEVEKRQVFHELAEIELIAFEGPPDFLAGEINRL
ncbi:tetratricopeptide repeat protein [Vibrio sp. WJH972]